MSSTAVPISQKQKDFYQNLRGSLQDFLDSKSAFASKAASIILLAPDLFHLLIKSLLDNRIDASSKKMIAIGLLYFISPVDLLPAFIFGPVGLVDNVIVAAFVVNTLLNKYPEEVIKDNWAGDQDILEVIRNFASMGQNPISKVPAGPLVSRLVRD